MRILKKLLLAGAFIGVLGSFGFVEEAKADDKIQSVTLTGDKVTVTFDNVVSANKVSLYLEDVDIATLDVVSTNKTAEKTGVKTTVNATTFPSSLTTLKTIKVEAVSSNGVKLDTKTEVAATPLYKLSVLTNPTNGGTITLDSGAEKTSDSTFDYTQADGGSPHKLVAKAANRYKFSGWSGASASATSTLDSIYVSASGSNIYTANFTSTSYGQAILNAKYNGVTYTSDTTESITMKVGESITFSFNKPSKEASGSASISVDQDDSYLSKTGSTSSTITYKAVKNSGDDYAEVTAVASASADFEDSESIYIYVDGVPSGGRVNTSDFKDYITEGYTLEFTVKAADTSVDLSDYEWIASTGSDYFDSYSMDATSNNVKYEKKVKLKFKSEKQDKGTNSQEVKMKCRRKNTTDTFLTIDSDTDTEKKITVYSNPTNSYSSDRTLSYKVPAKVNTGTETGKDSSLSYTQDTVAEVKGVRLNVVLNDNILGTTTTAASKGTSATIEAATMESIVKNLGDSGKFTGDCTVAFRVYPCDGSGNCNKKVYHEAYAKVYKIVVRVGSSATAGSTASAYDLPLAFISPAGSLVATSTTTGSAKEYVFYALEGQTIDLTTVAGLKDATVKDNAGNVVTKIVASSDTAKNISYTAVLGDRAAAADREGLDKVPKTGQSNVFVYVMIAAVVSFAGYGLYVYNKKGKKNI